MLIVSFDIAGAETADSILLQFLLDNSEHGTKIGQRIAEEDSDSEEELRVRVQQNIATRDLKCSTTSTYRQANNSTFFFSLQILIFSVIILKVIVSILYCWKFNPTLSHIYLFIFYFFTGSQHCQRFRERFRHCSMQLSEN